MGSGTGGWGVGNPRKGYVRSNSHNHHTYGLIHWDDIPLSFCSDPKRLWSGLVVFEECSLSHITWRIGKCLSLSTTDSYFACYPTTFLMSPCICFSESLQVKEVPSNHRKGPCFLVVFLENLGGWESRTSPARKPFMSNNAHWLQFPPKSSSNFLIQNTTS